MTDAEVIAAIRRQHLKANIAEHEQNPHMVIAWDEATVDMGSMSLWGLGPYLHVHVRDIRGDEQYMVRVYPCARLRRRLAQALDGRGGHGKARG